MSFEGLVETCYELCAWRQSFALFMIGFNLITIKAGLKNVVANGVTLQQLSQSPGIALHLQLYGMLTHTHTQTCTHTHTHTHTRIQGRDTEE